MFLMVIMMMMMMMMMMMCCNKQECALSEHHVRGTGMAKRTVMFTIDFTSFSNGNTFYECPIQAARLTGVQLS
jgi:hypothetical protein